MSTHNIGFYEDLTKIIFQLSSNMHVISSSVTNLLFLFLHHLVEDGHQPVFKLAVVVVGNQQVADPVDALFPQFFPFKGEIAEVR